jgi:hypothetical protein
MTVTTIASGINQRFIDPLTDFGFKHLLGGEPNKEIIIEFLNAILPGKRKLLIWFLVLQNMRQALMRIRKYSLI